MRLGNVNVRTYDTSVDLIIEVESSYRLTAKDRADAVELAALLEEVAFDFLRVKGRKP